MLWLKKIRLRKLMGKADAARDARDWRRAAELYSSVTNIDPSRAAAWVQLGNCAKEARLFNLSAHAYTQALSLQSSNPDIYLQLGHLKKLTGNPFDALWSYRRSLELGGKSDAENEINAIIATITGSKQRNFGASLNGSILGAVNFPQSHDLSGKLGQIKEAAENALMSGDISPKQWVAFQRFSKILTGG